VGIEFGRRILAFLRSTFIGGLFVLAPIVVLLVIIGQVVDVVYSAIRPAFDWVPDKSIGGVSIVMLFVFAGVIGLCFAAGLGAKVAVTKRFVRWIESMLLSNLPGYSLMKGVGENLVGIQGTSERQTVLARFESSWVIGFVMDRLENGRLIVFVPGVPNALTGTLHIMDPSRVEPLGIPIRTTLDFLNRLGVEAAPALRERLGRLPVLTESGKQ
jgi:uncharacterized membrane protein